MMRFQLLLLAFAFSILPSVMTAIIKACQKDTRAGFRGKTGRGCSRGDEDLARRAGGMTRGLCWVRVAQAEEGINGEIHDRGMVGSKAD